MKKLLIGLLALGTITSASASMLEINGPLDATFLDAQVAMDKSHFETLGDLFKVGTRPNLKKISNVAWAGRCFLDISPNEPTNAGYIFRQKSVCDAGPIGGETKCYEASSYWKKTAAPNYFDQMNIEQVFTALNSSFSIINASIKADSIELDIDPGKSNLRVSGSYLVEEISGKTVDVGPIGDSGPIGKDTVEVRCYYFIPELPNL